MLMSGRIRQTRNMIEKCVRRICERMGEGEGDLEPLGEGREVEVTYRVEEDLFTRVEVVDVWIYSEAEREYKNVGQLMMRRLQEAAEAFNSEQESLYLERLTTRGRRDYYAWTA